MTTIPQEVTDLARQVDQAREDFAARRITLADYDTIADQFDQALDDWKAIRILAAPTVDLEDEDVDEHAVKDDQEPRPGDILEDADGLRIITPDGRWTVTDGQAFDLIRGLAAKFQARLTRSTSHHTGA